MGFVLVLVAILVVLQCFRNRDLLSLALFGQDKMRVFPIFNRLRIDFGIRFNPAFP